MLLTFANVENFLSPNIVNMILGTIVYAALGSGLLIIAYKVFDIINPLDFDKELANNNTALAIMLAGFFIGVSIVIGAAIFG